MFIKEVFSKEKKNLIETLQKKTFVGVKYEKSYIRGVTSNLTQIRILDNNSLLFHKRKKKISSKTKPARKSRKPVYSTRIAVLKKINRKKEFKGNFLYTTAFLYQNRKNHFLRFQLPLYTITKSKKFLDTFVQGVERLSRTTTIKGGCSLIFLSISKGGYTCYSSGFRGFLPRKHSKSIFKDWKTHLRNTDTTSSFVVLRYFMKSQKSNFFTSPPLRYPFVLKSLIDVVTLKKKRFLLSRKKRLRLPTKVKLKMVFYSTQSFKEYKDKLKRFKSAQRRLKKKMSRNSDVEA